MKKSKKIDKLIKKSFQDVEISPSPKVWERIQAELDKKDRSRRVIPLWLRYAGIAALLALIFTISYQLYDTPKTPDNNLTTTPLNEEYPEENTQDKNGLTLETPEVETNGKYQIPSGKTEPSNPFEEAKKSKNIAAPSITSERKSVIIQNNRDKDHHWEDNLSNYDTGLAAKNEDQNRNVSQESKADAITGHDPKVLEDKNAGLALENQTGNDQIEDGAKDPDKEMGAKKKLLLDALTENKNNEDNDLKDLKERIVHRWNLTPKVAPVYYGSFGNGSSIDPNFSQNPQKGDVNMSYGLQLAYSVNHRLSVRVGINTVDLSYSTTDIVIGTGPVAMALKSVNYGSKQIVITAVNKKDLKGSNPDNFGEITLKTTSGDARLVQNINYFEIPVELKYSLIDGKLGVNLIGGFSTLFLGENDISVRSDNFNSVLGEANNLNDVSFSTNIGLGLDYQLSKRFLFNIEPMFKYQLNPYSDSFTNFKPYYLGVYSGFSFKF